MQIGPLSLGVLGVAGHRDVPPGPFLVASRAQFAPVQEPGLERRGVPNLAGARLELVEQRRQRGPIAQVRPRRHEPAGLVRRQLPKRQQTHRARMATPRQAPSPKCKPSDSGQNILQHLAMDIGQSHLAPAEADREALVVQAEEVQHRGVQIVNLDRLLDRFVAVLVGGPVDTPALDAAAGQPDRETERVVIPAVGTLGERGATKLPRPNDQRARRAGRGP